MNGREAGALPEGGGWREVLARWRRRAPDERDPALARAGAAEVSTGPRVVLFVRDPEWEETSRARGWVNSEALARLLAEALTEEGLACYVVVDA